MVTRLQTLSARDLDKFETERGSGFMSGAILSQTRGGHDFAMPSWTMIPLLYHAPPNYRVGAISKFDNESVGNFKYTLQDQYGTHWMIDKNELPKHTATMQVVQKLVVEGLSAMKFMRYDGAVDKFDAALKELWTCHRETPIELWIQIHRGHALLRAGLLRCPAVQETNTLLTTSEETFSRCQQILLGQPNPQHAFNKSLLFSAMLGMAWISFFRGDEESTEQLITEVGKLGQSLDPASLRADKDIDSIFLQVSLQRVIGSLEDRNNWQNSFGHRLSDYDEDKIHVSLLDIEMCFLLGEYDIGVNTIIMAEECPANFVSQNYRRSRPVYTFLEQLRAGYTGNAWLAVGAYREAKKAYTDAYASKSLLLKAAALVGMGNVDSRNSVAKWETSAHVKNKIDDPYDMETNGSMSGFKDAEKNYKEALAIYDQLGYKEAQIIVHCNLGNLYHEWGQLGLALERYGEAMKYISGKMKTSSTARLLHTKCAWLHIEKRNWVEAFESIQDAQKIPTTIDKLAEARVQHLFGAFYMKRAFATKSTSSRLYGWFTEGEQSNYLYKAKEPLVRAAELFAELVWPLRYNVTFWLMLFEQHKETYTLLVWCLACQQNSSTSIVEALVWSERSRSRAFLAEKRESFSDRIRTRSAAVREAWEATASEAFDTRGWDEAAENLQRVLCECKLPTGTVVVEYMLCADFGFLIFVLDVPGGKPKMKRISFRKQELNGKGLDRGKLTALVNRVISRSDPKSGQAETNLASLYKLLMKPVERWLKDAAHLVIIPHPILVKVPFHALIDGNKKHLIERYTLSCAESIRSLVQCSLPWDSSLHLRQGQGLDNNAGSLTDCTKRKWLVIGINEHRPVARNLKHAEWEARVVASLKPRPKHEVHKSPQILLGSEATKEKVNESINEADVIHLATHGIINEDYERGGILFAIPEDRHLATPGIINDEYERERILSVVSDDSEIEKIVKDVVHGGQAYSTRQFAETTDFSLRDDLNDDPRASEMFKTSGKKFVLSANEILEMPLKAQLVVLSACQSADGVMMGEGVAGLGRALLLAGVPCTVLSLWPVSDNATISFMKKFYEKLAGGLSVADAMKATMVFMIKAEVPSPDARNKRMYTVRQWAAFVAFGAPCVQLVDLPEEKELQLAARSPHSQHQDQQCHALQPRTSIFHCLLDALSMRVAVATVVVILAIVLYGQQAQKFV